MKTFFFLLALLASSCSQRVLEAMEAHKMHDEYFILRKNGHYSFKILLLGVFRMPDSRHGRYIRSNDTVYFVSKEARKTFIMHGYGIIDSSSGTFFYRPNDTLEWETMDIREMPTRKRDRQMKR